MHLLLLLNATGGGLENFIIENLGRVGSPALVLLILALAFAIRYFMRQSKEKDAIIKEKENTIQNLHKNALESSINNLKIIHDIESSIDKNYERSHVIENLLRDNNSFLKSIMRSLNLQT